MAAQRILVIEDNPAALDALGSLLTEDGYVVRTAATGQAGLDCIREFRPDTIVCDFYLPDLDGLQILRQTRAALQHVAFIVVTAECGGVEAERLLRREADFFFYKPLDLPSFRNLLRQLQRVPAGERVGELHPSDSNPKEWVYERA